MIGSAKILVVDDDPTNVDLIGELCRVAGYSVITAVNGPDALELAKRDRPDLILLDVMMPGMDGYEVLAKLKIDVKLSEVPVILVTAVDEAEGKMRGLGSGAAEFVHKPFRAIELQQRIKTVLELSYAKRQLREAEIELVGMRATDPVTGVGNFHRLHAVLEYEFGRASRYARPLSCAVIADDALDSLLSATGREATEEVLRHIAKTIRAEVREVDRIFRIDMAEFVVVLPETPGSGARVALDRIAKTILGTERGSAHRPRIFSGICSFPNAQLKRAEDMFRGVNVAVDAARRQGGDVPVLVDFHSF